MGSFTNSLPKKGLLYILINFIIKNRWENTKKTKRLHFTTFVNSTHQYRQVKKHQKLKTTDFVVLVIFLFPHFPPAHFIFCEIIVDGVEGLFQLLFHRTHEPMVPPMSFSTFTYFFSFLCSHWRKRGSFLHFESSYYYHDYDMSHYSLVGRQEDACL